MTDYVLSPRAQADIENIWDYTVANWGIDQASFYIQEIKTAVENVASDPRKGRKCDDVRAGYSQYPAGSHILFYRTTSSGIDIIRILHQRMDCVRHL